MTVRQLIQRPLVLTIALLVVGIGVVAVLVIQSGKATADQSPIRQETLPVKTISASRVESIRYLQTFVGSIKARRSSDLAFERSARISSVEVEDGDTVDANQVLAKLDTRDLEIALEEAEAAAANGYAIFEEMIAGPRKQTIESARAEVDALTAEAALAQQNRVRRKTLEGSDSISAEELQRAESQWSSAKARLESAEAKLQELLEGTRDEQIWAQYESLRRLEARVADVELLIQKSSMLAPYKGKIARRYLDEGVVVAPGSPLLKIVESDQLEIVIGVPPSALADVTIGTEFDCLIENVKSKVKVQRILPEADTQTRLIPVVFQLSDIRFRPGQIARLKIEATQELPGFWVPTVALLPGSKGLWTIFVVEGKEGGAIVQTRTVEVVFTDGPRSLIRGAIDEGDQIVSEGVHKINRGQRVKINNTK